jgi:hypothetical protein
MRNRAGIGSSLWYGGRPSSNSITVQPTLLLISKYNVEGGGTRYLKRGLLLLTQLPPEPLLSVRCGKGEGYSSRDFRRRRRR